MKDNRTFTQKYFKRHPNWKDQTPKGRLINFVLRGTLLIATFYLIALTINRTGLNFLIVLIGYTIVGMIVGYWIDQYTCTKFTFATQHEELMEKAKNVIPKEDK